MTQNVITIDQAKIDVPDFPRSAAWWRNFLPLWLSDRRYFEKSEAEWRVAQRTNITVDDTTHVVFIRTEDKKHAVAIANYLSTVQRLSDAWELAE